MVAAAVVLALGAVQFGRAAEPRGALLFEDTFDGTAVDETKWGYETGFVRNDEPQWYQPANASVSNGILTIEARRERAGEARYTSASLCTLGKFSFTYGHVEMRAKLPDGKSVWPAFWMLGTNIVSRGTGWPKCGEIDIMEYWGHTPTDTTSCVHYWSPDVKGRGHAFRGPFRLRAEGLSEGFHVYSLDWTKDGLAFGFDGKTYAEVPLSAFDLPDGSNAFRRPQYLLMNLALTRKWGGHDDFPSVDVFPKRYEIDYVRVYAPLEPASSGLGLALRRGERELKTWSTAPN